MTFFFEKRFVFAALIVTNLLNYADRGIIPGATNEFNSFIDDSLHQSSTDIFLGVLQSAFIVGFIVGSVVFGHIVHVVDRFYLIGK